MYVETLAIDLVLMTRELKCGPPKGIDWPIVVSNKRISRFPGSVPHLSRIAQHANVGLAQEQKELFFIGVPPAVHAMSKTLSQLNQMGGWAFEELRNEIDETHQIMQFGKARILSVRHKVVELYPSARIKPGDEDHDINDTQEVQLRQNSGGLVLGGTLSW